MPIHALFYRPAIWTSKVGQGDLDLMSDQGSLIASGSVSLRARVQASVCVYIAVTTYAIATLVVPKLIRTF